MVAVQQQQQPGIENNILGPLATEEAVEVPYGLSQSPSPSPSTREIMVIAADENDCLAAKVEKKGAAVAKTKTLKAVAAVGGKPVGRKPKSAKEKLSSRSSKTVAEKRLKPNSNVGDSIAAQKSVPCKKHRPVALAAGKGGGRSPAQSTTNRTIEKPPKRSRCPKTKTVPPSTSSKGGASLASPARIMRTPASSAHQSPYMEMLHRSASTLSTSSQRPVTLVSIPQGILDALKSPSSPLPLPPLASAIRNEGTSSPLKDVDGSPTAKRQPLLSFSSGTASSHHRAKNYNGTCAEAHVESEGDHDDYQRAKVICTTGVEGQSKGSTMTGTTASASLKSGSERQGSPSNGIPGYRRGTLSRASSPPSSPVRLRWSASSNTGSCSGHSSLSASAQTSPVRTSVTGRLNSNNNSSCHSSPSRHAPVAVLQRPQKSLLPRRTADQRGVAASPTPANMPTPLESLNRRIYAAVCEVAPLIGELEELPPRKERPLSYYEEQMIQQHGHRAAVHYQRSLVRRQRAIIDSTTLLPMTTRLNVDGAAATMMDDLQLMARVVRYSLEKDNWSSGLTLLQRHQRTCASLRLAALQFNGSCGGSSTTIDDEAAASPFSSSVLQEGETEDRKDRSRSSDVFSEYSITGDVEMEAASGPNAPRRYSSASTTAPRAERATMLMEAGSNSGASGFDGNHHTRRHQVDMAVPPPLSPSKPAKKEKRGSTSFLQWIRASFGGGKASAESKKRSKDEKQRQKQQQPPRSTLPIRDSSTNPVGIHSRTTLSAKQTSKEQSSSSVQNEPLSADLQQPKQPSLPMPLLRSVEVQYPDMPVATFVLNCFHSMEVVEELKRMVWWAAVHGFRAVAVQTGAAEEPTGSGRGGAGVGRWGATPHHRQPSAESVGSSSPPAALCASSGVVYFNTVLLHARVDCWLARRVSTTSRVRETGVVELMLLPLILEEAGAPSSMHEAAGIDEAVSLAYFFSAATCSPRLSAPAI